MGDRLTIWGLKCAYCKAIQHEVYLAESCGFDTHDCEKCGKNNIVTTDYCLKKNSNKDLEGRDLK